MAYKRKTRDAIGIFGLYCGEYSLECNAENTEDARRLLREYRENCPGTPFRIRVYRERVEA